jgi:hypothetical protein
VSNSGNREIETYREEEKKKEAKKGRKENKKKLEMAKE